MTVLRVNGGWMAGPEIKAQAGVSAQAVNRVLHKAEVAKQVSQTWFDGVPVWRIAPKVDNATANARRTAARRDLRRKLSD